MCMIGLACLKRQALPLFPTPFRTRVLIPTPPDITLQLISKPTAHHYSSDTYRTPSVRPSAAPGSSLPLHRGWAAPVSDEGAGDGGGGSWTIIRGRSPSVVSSSPSAAAGVAGAPAEAAVAAAPGVEAASVGDAAAGPWRPAGEGAPSPLPDSSLRDSRGNSCGSGPPSSD